MIDSQTEQLEACWYWTWL